MDYRRFLAAKQDVVAPIVDGAAWLRDRSVRSQAAPGWYRVQVKGRSVQVGAPATGDEIAALLQTLPLVRGPVIALDDGWGVVLGGAGCGRVELCPVGEEPSLFAPLRARRWPIGGLLFWEGLDFEGEAEEGVRRAVEDGRALDEKGVSAALRAAFVFATTRAAGRALQIAASPSEVMRFVNDIAARGRPAADEALRTLATERALEAARRAAAAQVRRIRTSPVRPIPVDPVKLEERVERALRNTGARPLAVRRSAPGQVEVRWALHGERFISLVDEGSLRVIDSGVCLADHDDLVTLESLPGVIEQAIHEDALVITRHH